MSQLGMSSYMYTFPGLQHNGGRALVQLSPDVEETQVLGPQFKQPTYAALCSKLAGFKWG